MLRHTPSHQARIMILSLLLILLLILLAGACAPGPRLTTAVTKQPPAEGTYTLLLHGCNYGNDPATIAFFWPQDQAYQLIPYSPAFQFRRESGLTADRALAAAEEFINCSPHFSHPRLSAIRDQQQRLIGYELRPLYQLPSPFPRQDMLNVSYYELADQQIRVYITPLPLLEIEDPEDN